VAERICKEPGCDRVAAPRSQRCDWHRLARLPLVEQEEAARRRLAAQMARPGFVYIARAPKGRLGPGLRWCSGCQSVIPLWYASGSRCRADARLSRRASHVEKTYGLDAADVAALEVLQRGRCAICRAKPRSQALAVDHDHKTGEPRGLCCKRCNHDLLGAAHDDVVLLKRAVYYLEHPPTSGRWRPPEDDEPIPY
jgi:hypothetical protein